MPLARMQPFLWERARITHPRVLLNDCGSIEERGLGSKGRGVRRLAKGYLRVLLWDFKKEDATWSRAVIYEVARTPAILSFMIITYHGGECIKVAAGDTTLVFGPASKRSESVKPANFGADIVFVSLNHPDMNGTEEVSRGGKEPFIISGPGEYEISSVSATGIPVQSSYGGVARTNTIYGALFDGTAILYLGAVSDPNLSADVLEQIETVDVLFVPIGGGEVLGSAGAHKLSVLLEAKVVIPIHWGDIGEKDALKNFLKEAGAEDIKPVEKLTIKQKDVAAMTGEVVVLKQ